MSHTQDPAPQPPPAGIAMTCMPNTDYLIGGIVGLLLVAFPPSRSIMASFWPHAPLSVLALSALVFAWGTRWLRTTFDPENRRFHQEQRLLGFPTFFETTPFSAIRSIDLAVKGGASLPHQGPADALFWMRYRHPIYIIIFYLGWVTDLGGDYSVRLQMEDRSERLLRSGSDREELARLAQALARITGRPFI